MSSALIWEIVKNNNSFIRKSVNGTIFTAEPANLTKTHSFKASGLANKRAIGVEADGKQLKLVIKSAKKNKLTTQVLRKGAAKANAAVQKITGRYRRDLAKTAVARVSALYKAVNNATRAKKN